MSVAPKVSAKVPARRRPGRPPRYLTGSPSGWRFQLRLPAALLADSCLAKPKGTIRASIGSRPRREAERLAGRLAALCQAVFENASGAMAGTEGLEGAERDLVAQVVAACQAAIASAMERPSEAIGLARGLETALTTLKLVESEIGKGPAGIPAVVGHADALARGALTHLLRLAPDPRPGLGALANVVEVAPQVKREMASGEKPAPSSASAVPAGNTDTMPEPGSGLLPTFGQLSSAYIKMRIARDGAKPRRSGRYACAPEPGSS